MRFAIYVPGLGAVAAGNRLEGTSSRAAVRTWATRKAADAALVKIREGRSPISANLPAAFVADDETVLEAARKLADARALLERERERHEACRTRFAGAMASVRSAPFTISWNGGPSTLVTPEIAAARLEEARLAWLETLQEPTIRAAIGAGAADLLTAELHRVVLPALTDKPR